MSPRSWVRQQHGDALVPVDLDQEVPHALLGDHVETDRGLVEEKQLRAVQHRSGQLTADSLAQRELAHRGLKEGIDVQHLSEPHQVPPVAVRRDLVDVAQQVERVLERQVPPELDALAEHRADLAREPTRRRDGSKPATSTPPDDGTRIPVSILIVVDLPAPFGPR